MARIAGIVLLLLALLPATLSSPADAAPAVPTGPGALAHPPEHPKESPPSVGEVYSALRRRAREQSYEIRMAQATARQRSAQRWTAWSRWLPHVDFQLTQARRQDYTVLTSGALGDVQNAFGGLFNPVPISLSRWDLNLSLPLYQRSVHLGVQQAAADVELADAQLGQRLTELDWRLRGLVGSYLFENYRAAVLRASLEIARSNRREAALRFELGQKTKIDVLRAEAGEASLDSDRTLQDQSRAVAWQELLEYTGLPAREIAATGLEALVDGGEDTLARAIDEFASVDDVLNALEPFLTRGFDPAWPDLAAAGASGSVEGVPASIEAQVARHSPTYRALVADEDASVTRAKAAMASEFPQLTLQGNLNKQADNWGDTITPTERSYSATLALTIPIFSGGSLISSYHDEKYAQEAVAARAARDVASLKKELEREVAGIRALRQTLAARRLQAEQAAEILRLSQISYKVGKTTIVELLGSQNDLLTAKVNLARAKLDLAGLARQLAWNLGVDPAAGEGKGTEK